MAQDITRTQHDSLLVLDEFVVTGKVLREEVIPVQTLSGKQLERLAVHNVADAIRYFSGIQVKDYGGIGGLKTINVRSMGTNHVGVFYDGVAINNAQNGIVDLGRFSLDNVEAISVYNGQKSAILQTAKDFSSASAIYLSLRVPTFAKGRENNFKASFKTGSFHLVNPAFTWERKVNDEVASTLHGEYLYTSGKYKFTYRVKDSYDTTAIRKNGDVNALRLEGGLLGKLSRGYWRAKAYLYLSDRGYPGAVVKNKFSHEDRQKDLSTFLQGTYKRDYTDWYTTLFNVKYTYDYLHYLADPERDAALMYINNHYYQHETYLSLAHRFTLFPWWQVAVATDYSYSLLDANLYKFAFPRRHTGLLSFATSLQWDFLKLQASLLGTYLHENVQRGKAAKHKIEWTPTVVASYQPFSSHDLHLRAFYKRIFRTPTLNDLYYTFIGNKYLEPEYTNQYNVGVTYKKTFKGWLRQFKLQVDGYYNEVKNKIVAMPTSNFFRWTMVNFGTVQIHGIDAGLQSDIYFRPLWISGRLTYTYQVAQDKTDPTDPYYGGQIPYIPWHSGSAILNARYHEWDLSYSFIYTGERYMSVANIPENYFQPWYTSDIALSRTLTFDRNTLRLSLEVNNLLNQQYEVVRSYPMPGTNFKFISQYIF